MTVVDKKKEVSDPYEESELYKHLKTLDNEALIKLFIKYLKKDLDNVSSDLFEQRKEENSVPDTIFNEKLTALESIVKYLKENKDLSYNEIANLINRDARNIWQIYDTTKEKLIAKFVIKNYEFLIPLLIFSNRKLSILENLVFYLKTKFDLSYHKIAILIHRDDRTVWTVYQKAKKKNEKKQ